MPDNVIELKPRLRGRITVKLAGGRFFTIPDSDTVKKRTLAGEVRFVDVKKLPDENKSAGRVALHFHPKGLAEPAVIHLAGPGNQIRTLVVKPFNGRLVVREGYLE